jgi:dipeptidyl-peptidase-4
MVLLRLTLLSVLCLSAAELSASESSSSWDRFNQIPRAAEVNAVSGEARRLVVPVGTRSVRWDLEAGLAFVRIDGAWAVVDLANCTVREDGDDLEVPRGEKKARDQNRGRGGWERPARGRQATRVTSPEEAWTAVHENNNVLLVDETDVARAITTEGTDRIRYGTASWVYGEELDQSSAMWFSPDEKHLAFYAFDVSEVPDYYLLSGLTKLRTTVMDEAYPKPGDANPVAGIRVHDIDSGETLSVDVGDDPDQYIYRVAFSPDSRFLTFLRMNRLQNRLELVVVDPTTGTSRTLIDETQPTWVAHDPEMRWLEDGRRFIWSSERSGYKTYELWDIEEGLLAVLGPGDFPSDSIVAVREEQAVPGGGRLLYSGTGGAHALNVHLHAADFDGGGHRRLTGDGLTHSNFFVAPDLSATVAMGEAWDSAPALMVYCGEAAEPLTLAATDTSRLERSGSRPSELFEFTTGDGTETCFGRIDYPRDFDTSKSWPILVDVYGGPESRAISNRFAVSDPMTEFGFVKVRIDNRGTEGRGKAFEGATYQKLGLVDLDDQAQGVKTLLERHDWLDPDRVGITGHSYGGYMSALAVLRHPETFSVAVAGAPVTDWRNYDTIYTERYMRTPAENAENYDAGSCVKLARNLKGEFLLLHGMVDDNVHPSNAWQLASALQSLDIPFEMQFFPDSAHGIYSPAFRSAKWSFLVDHLVGSEQATP